VNPRARGARRQGDPLAALLADFCSQNPVRGLELWLLERTIMRRRGAGRALGGRGSSTTAPIETALTLGAAAPSAACSLSDISGWRDGVLYPLAGVAEESGAAHFGFGGAMLLDPLG